MTDTQLHLAIGVPVVINLLGFALVAIMLSWINGRMTRLEDKFDNLAGTIIDVDNRVIRIGEKLGVE